MASLSQLGGFVKVSTPWKVHNQVVGNDPYWRLPLTLDHICPLFASEAQRASIRFYRVSNVQVTVNISRELNFERTILAPANEDYALDRRSQVTHNVTFVPGVPYHFDSLAGRVFADHFWQAHETYGYLTSDDVPYMTVVTVSGVVDMWWAPVDVPTLRDREGFWMRRQVIGPRIRSSYLPSVAYSSRYSDLESMGVGPDIHRVLSDAFYGMVSMALPPYSSVSFLEREIYFTGETYEERLDSDSDSDDEELVFAIALTALRPWVAADQPVWGLRHTDEDVPIPTPLRPRVVVRGDDQVTYVDHWYDVSATHPPAA